MIAIFSSFKAYNSNKIIIFYNNHWVNNIFIFLFNSFLIIFFNYFLIVENFIHLISFVT